MNNLSSEDIEIGRPNKYQIGPGFGFFLLGLIYLVFWLMPFALEAYIEDPRWAHNWAYAIIIMTIGASFHHKSITSRIIALIQSFMMPVTASGLVNTLLMAVLTTIIISIWAIVVFIERRSSKLFFQERISKRTWQWSTMHSLIISWILFAHMGLLFFFVRLPFEAQLDHIGTWLGQYLAFLNYLPPERRELVTYVFDINLIILAILFGYEQFKMGYNIKNKPWPRISFWYIWVTVAMGFVFLGWIL